MYKKLEIFVGRVATVCEAHSTAAEKQSDYWDFTAGDEPPPYIIISILTSNAGFSNDKVLNVIR